MDKIIILKEIDNRPNIIVLLVSINNHEYILERHKLFPNYQNKPTDFFVWRKISFFERINKLDITDSIFFTKMISYTVHTYNSENIPKLMPKNKTNKELDISPFYIDIISESKDGTVDTLINTSKLTIKQKYSIVIQSLYIIYLMHLDGYQHRNIKLSNIHYTRCAYDKILEIKIFDSMDLTKSAQLFQIKSYGYIISFGDYNRVTNDSFELSDKIKNSHNFFKKYNVDTSFLIDVLLLNNNMLKYVRRTQDNPLTHTDILRIIAKKYLEEYNEIKKIFSNIYGNDTDQFEVDFVQYEIIILFEIFYKKEFCDILGIDFVPNFINNEHIELIKFNLLYMNVPIKELIIHLNNL